MDYASPRVCVDFFKTLLRFRTVSAEGPRTGAYVRCVEWLDAQCRGIGLETRIVTPVPGKPILIATWTGLEPHLPCIVLNSHYDVVPVMDEHWNTDAFAAVEKDGRIYGRGTQDMKCVVAQYILAIGRMRQADPSLRLRRTVHLTFVPDEETGGLHGMGEFIKTEVFESLKPIGCALDEGLANPKPNEYTVFYGERAPLWILVEALGPTGHGSRFIPNTAVEKLLGVLNKAMDHRRGQEKRLGYPGEVAGCKHCEALKLGDVMTLNLTMLRGGVSGDGGETFALNVIPTKFEAGFDIRVPVTVPIPKVKEMLDRWCIEEGLSWKFAPWSGSESIVSHPVSSIDKEESLWWRTFSGAADALGMKISPEIFPAGTDSRFLRQLGLPAFGFSPMAGSEIMLHEHNEYIDTEVFLKGVPIYEKIILDLANAVPDTGHGGAAAAAEAAATRVEPAPSKKQRIE